MRCKPDRPKDVVDATKVMRLVIVNLFSTYTTILTVLPQNHPGRTLALSMFLAVGTIMPIQHSMTPFYDRL
jgi:hypothetical protein